MRWRELVKTILAVSMLTLVAQLIFALVILFYGVGMVSEDILDESASLSEAPLFLILHEIVIVATLSGGTLLLYYFLLVVAITASLTSVFISSGRTYLGELFGKAKSREHSAIFDIGGLMFAVLLINLIIVLGAGIGEDDVPSGGTVEEGLFYLASASVWEEIAVRVILIGLPLLLIDIARNKTRKLHTYILGGGFKFGTPEIILLIGSSILFGYAHFLGGWGEWKIPAAGIAGVAFGYLFLKHGIAAAITLHFAFDYLLMPSLVLDSFALEALAGLAALMWAGLGAVFLVYYFVRIMEFFTGRLYFERKPEPVGVPWADPRFAAYYQQLPQQMPTYQPVGHQPYQQPAYQQPQQPLGGYVCPSCGHIEARWASGKFQCLRCGHLS